MLEQWLNLTMRLILRIRDICRAVWEFVKSLGGKYRHEQKR